MLSRALQYGISVLCAEPVTGSRGEPTKAGVLIEHGVIEESALMSINASHLRPALTNMTRRFETAVRRSRIASPRAARRMASIETTHSAGINPAYAPRNNFAVRANLNQFSFLVRS